MPSPLLLIAGGPGAGKTALGAAHLRARGLDVFDPVDFARDVVYFTGSDADAAVHEGLEEGIRRLVQAVEADTPLAIETTLADPRVVAQVLRAAGAGRPVGIWFFGLADAGQHVARARRRAAVTGLPLDEGRIRQEVQVVLEHLCLVAPHVQDLRLLDNSGEREPGEQFPPPPSLVLDVPSPATGEPVRFDLPSTPDWAKPVFEALQVHWLYELGSCELPGDLSCPDVCRSSAPDTFERTR